MDIYYEHCVYVFTIWYLRKIEFQRIIIILYNCFVQVNIENNNSYV